MKTILFILIVALLFASCSAPVARPEARPGHSAVADSVKVDSTATAPKTGTDTITILSSMLFLIVLYVAFGPKN